MKATEDWVSDETGAEELELAAILEETLPLDEDSGEFGSSVKVTEDASALMLLGTGMTVSPSSVVDALGAAELEETPPLDEEEGAAEEDAGSLEDGSAEELEEAAAEEDDAEKDADDEGAAELLDDAPSGSSQAKLSPSSSSCRLRTLRALGGQNLCRVSKQFITCRYLGIPVWYSIPSHTNWSRIWGRVVDSVRERIITA
jgi:hypothetical protein